MAGFTVTTADDTTDASDGVLSLREAIAQANAATGHDTITFASGLAGKTIILTQGELMIDNGAAGDDGSLTINGDLANGDITLSGNDASRVLHIVGDGAGDVQAVELNSLTVAHGFVTDSSGAGILAENADLAVVAGIVRDGSINRSYVVYGPPPTAGQGAGIASLGGNLTLTASTIESNHNYSYAIGGGGSGGIYKNGGALTMAEGTISNNHGSGIYVDAATASIRGSTIASNYASAGGGILARDGTVTVDTTTIAGNSSSNDGGGIVEHGGTLSITASTISGNNTRSSGGGIAVDGVALTLANTTVYNNSSNYDGGGIQANGGSVVISNSTIVGNSTYYYFSSGSGLNTTDVVPSVANSILSGNLVAAVDVSGTILSNGHNLFGQVAVDGSIAGDLLGITDARVGALAYNGGPTATMALLGGSPAIDAGVNSDASGLTTDQRGDGFARIDNGLVDIGAFELRQQPVGTLFTAGNDTVNLDAMQLTNYGATTDALGGNDTVTLSSGQNVGVAFRGGAGNDTLTGSVQDDIIFGDAGNDVIDGHGGADTIDGGAGSDALRPSGGDITGTTFTNIENLADSATLGTAQLNAFAHVGSDTPGTAASYNYTLTDAAEAIDLTGKVEAADRFTVDTAEGDSRITMDAAATGSATLIGNSGNDTLIGGGGEDVFYASGGADVLDGGVGSDTLVAYDKYLTGTTVTSIENLADGATLGTALLNSFAHIGTGSPGFEEYYYYNLTDAAEAVDLTGKVEAADRFEIYGSQGDDHVAMDAANTGGAFMSGDIGNDSLAGGGGGDGFYGGGGGDQIGGGGGNDFLNGDDGNDILDGSASGDDFMYGGAGDDILAAGQGSDALEGGDGADRFTLRPGGAGIDRIADFTPGTDHLHNGGGLDEATLIATALVTDGGSTVLTLGTDDFVIVRNATGIAADWFA